MNKVARKLSEFTKWVLSIVIGFFDLSFIGFVIIFGAVGIFGEAEMWSWQMWLEVLGVAFGGTILIQYGKNSRTKK